MPQPKKHINRSVLSLVLFLLGLLLGFSITTMAMPGSPHAGSFSPANSANGMPESGKSAFSYTSEALTITETITHNFALDDGIQQDVVTVVVSNGGTAVSGLDVTFVVNGGASGINPVIKTDANGKSVLSLSSTVPGPVTVEAFIGGVSQGIVTVTFVAVAGPPDLTNPFTQLVIDLGVNTADNISTDKLHAHIADSNGNPVAGQLVVFTISGGTAGGTATIVGTGITNASGDAAITVTDPIAGSVAVSAKLGGVDITGSAATVFFIAGPPSTANPATQLIIDIPSAQADGVSICQVHAHIEDIDGNFVAGATVVFTIVGGTAGGTAVTSTLTVTTDAGGNAVLTITNTAAGTVDIGATVGAAVLNNSPRTVTFTSGPPSTTNPATQLIIDIPSATADGVSIDQVHAHVVDNNGVAVPGATVVFTITGGTAAGTAVTTGTGITNGSGDAILTITDITAGTVTISATIGGVAINFSPKTVVFVAGAPSPTNPGSQLIKDIDSVAADGVSTDQVHAHIVDANGNAVAGATVVFTVSGGTAGGTAVILGTGITDGSGNAVLTITNTIVGTADINATVGGTAINSSPKTVTFIAGPPSTSNPATQLITDIPSATADGVSIDQVHAHVVDGTGNLAIGDTVIFSITGGTAGGTAITSILKVATDAGGNAVLTITNLKAGTVIISATVGGAAINVPQTVTFVAGPPDLSKSIIITDKDSSAADGASTDIVHAYIVDVNGNPVSGQSINFSLTAGTANFVGPVTVVTDVNGNASISLTSTTAGNVGVAADEGGTVLSNSPKTITFINVPDIKNPLTTLSVVVPEALADGTSTTSVKVHVVDQNGAVLPGASIIFSVDSGNAQIVTPQPVITDANGDAIILITSTVAGDVLITATVNGIPIVNGSPARVHFAAINIYVPKVFTPNGDGVNDVLKPILVGISSFHYFNVYNRWGNLLFTTQDQNQGWDGKVKGVPQPVETYLWIAEGVDNSGKKVVQKGMVSLIR